MKRAARFSVALAASVALGATSSCALFRARPPVYPSEQRADGLVVQDLLVPRNLDLAQAADGDRVTLDYVARVKDGEVVDSSLERGQPAVFVLGNGEMPLVGLDRGVIGMRLGGRRRILAPPGLAFGEAGVPGLVPPDATIDFTVELVGLESADG